MRTLALSVIILGCLVGPALAILPSPFIGASVQVNSPTGNFSQTDIVNKDGGAKTGMGGEVDAGISTGSGSLYVGYRFSRHNADGSLQTPGGTASVGGNWDINRAVVGLRYNILGGTGVPIVPTIGGGLTFGKTKAAIAGAINNQDYQTDQTSKSSVGWFLELGGLIKTPGPLSIIGDIQYHSFDADFSSQLYNGKINVAFFTFQLGAQFALGPA